MFDPTTRLQAARMHSHDLHHATRAHHSARRTPSTRSAPVAGLHRRLTHIGSMLHRRRTDVTGQRSLGIIKG